MSCLNEIKDSIDFLTENEKKIANFILNFTEEIAYLSTQELSKRCGVSTSAISRFSKRLNYDGFKDLKLRIVKDLYLAKSSDQDIIVTEEDSTVDVFKKLSKGKVEVIEKTRSSVDLKSLNTAVQFINNSHRIFLFGIGSSALTCMDLQSKLLRVGKEVSFYQDAHTSLVNACNIKSHDVVVAISYSGDTKEVLLGVRKAKDNNAKVIAITASRNSLLAKEADVVLTVPKFEGDHIRIGAIYSKISIEVLTDTLFLNIAKEDIKKTIKSLKDSKKVIGQLK